MVELQNGEDVIWCDNRYYRTWNGMILKGGEKVAEMDKRVLQKYEDGKINFEQLVHDFEGIHEVRINADKLSEWLGSLGWKLR